MISNWPSASPITYGQALSNSVLTGGSANVPGAFAWVNPTNKPNTGTSNQSVRFSPAANYNSVTSSISLVVNKASPVLSWTPSPATTITYPAALSSTQLNATSSVAGTFSYNPSNTSVLNVGTNTLVATFTPTDPTNYTSGLTITNGVGVAKGSNVITFNSIPVKYLDEGSFTLNATASSGLVVSYTSSNTNVATVGGSTVTLKSVGTTTITASQSGNSNWNAATSVTQTLTVQPAINRGLIAYYPFDGNANDALGGKPALTLFGSRSFLTNGLSGGALRTDGDRSLYYSGGGYFSPAYLENSSLNAASFVFWTRNDQTGGAYSPSHTEEAWLEVGYGDTGAVTTIYGRALGTSGTFGTVTVNWADWKMFTMTISNNLTGSDWVQYLNGAETARGSTSQKLLPTANIKFGKHTWNAGAAQSARMTVEWDDLRLYDRT